MNGGIAVTGTNSLARKTPESLGISSRAILDFTNAVEASSLELHSLMLLRHGAVAAEGWWHPYGRDLRHHLFSLSKSFTSTAIGLAVQEGRFTVDDPVISFFPDDVPSEISSNLAAMKVKHLLSMSTGHDKDTTQRLAAGGQKGWVRGFLSLPVEHEPGTHFVYNSGASYMLSAIITKVTGQRLSEYLRPRLFEPLGIEGWSWEVNPEGVDMGGWGLSIRTEDIARFGQLYLNKGVWQGQRILSEEWVNQATSKQISNGDGGENDWAQGYGYQFWRSRHGAFRGDGMLGQYCIVMPEQDAVMAMTACVPDMGAVLNLVWQYILPAMKSDALPEDDTARGELVQKLTSLAIQPPGIKTHSPMAEQVSGRPISVTQPGGERWTITPQFEDGWCLIAIEGISGRSVLECGLGRWVVGETHFPGMQPAGSAAIKVAVGGGWSDDNTFELTTRFIETPNAVTVAVSYGGGEPRVELRTIGH